MWIVRGWLHPRMPEDIPADVANWLAPVADALQSLRVERNQGGESWT